MFEACSMREINVFHTTKSEYATKYVFRERGLTDFITKELDLVLKKNESLKIDIDSHVCHASIASSSCTPIACSTLSSTIENDINIFL